MHLDIPIGLQHKNLEIVDKKNDVIGVGIAGGAKDIGWQASLLSVTEAFADGVGDFAKAVVTVEGALEVYEQAFIEKYRQQGLAL